MNHLNQHVLLLVLLVAFLTSGQAMAREKENIEEQSAYLPVGFYAGGQASTNGLGVNVKYILNQRFTFKAGYESLNINYSFNLNENDISYDASFNLQTGGLFAQANWFYTRSLYLSAGAVASNFQPQMEGQAASDLQYGDISIPAADVGDFRFHVEPALRLSPYGALGFRSFFGKSKRVSYNFETGLYYMGPPQLEIETTGLLSPTADPVHKQAQNLEKQFEVYKYYPVVKLDIAIRLF